MEIFPQVKLTSSKQQTNNMHFVYLLFKMPPLCKKKLERVAASFSAHDIIINCRERIDFVNIRTRTYLHQLSRSL